MINKDLLKLLSETNGVSGYEGNPAEIIEDNFKPYCNELKKDKLGNLYGVKWAPAPEKAPTVMLAAHMDEIGLMVTRIEEGGFLRFTSVGGIDPRTMPAQEVVVHGVKALPGLIGAKPPHLTSSEDRKKALKLNELFIDTGLSEEEVKKIVSVGDMITIKRNFISLHNDFVAGKSLDDRAGVIMIYQVLKELEYLKHNVNLYAVATVQEEVGVRGATTSAYSIDPDIGIAIDVCHATMPGVDEEDAAEMGKGPAVGFGPHVHHKLFKKIKEVAEETNLNYQVQPSPRPGGTDAFAIQVARSGVASGLISIPLRYMHTSVETLDLNDIKQGGQLLARFISRIDNDFVEGLKCY